MNANALAVVVTPLVGGAALAACLAALERQGAAEIIVVAEAAPDAALGRARFLPTPGATIPERRLAGFMAADAPLVAFIEDTCLPGPEWCAALGAAFDERAAAAGGPVKIDPALPPRLKALAICEYSRFSAAKADRGPHEVNALSGANFALRRTSLPEAPAAGLVDNLVAAAIRRAGGRIVLDPMASVTYVAGVPAHGRLSARFAHGRIYGALLAGSKPLLVRFALGLTALGAPIVLIARNLRHAGPTLARSPATLAWTILMQCAWGCGEIIGKLTGKVGASMEQWT